MSGGVVSFEVGMVGRFNVECDVSWGVRACLRVLLLTRSSHFWAMVVLNSNRSCAVRWCAGVDVLIAEIGTVGSRGLGVTGLDLRL